MSLQMSLQTSPFLERLIRFLIPFFIGVTPDSEAARAEILETLESYGARTRAEFLNAVQTIAYGMSALDMLHEAKTTEMSPSMRLRFRGCANNLTRNGQKQEQTLIKRLGCDQPGAAKRPAEPIDDVPDAAVDMTLEEVKAELDKFRDRFFGPGALTGPTAKQDSEKRARGMSMLDIIGEELDLPVADLVPA
jgi:hypothetical protein